MVGANFCPTHTREERFSLIGASAILRISHLVIDALYREVRGQLVPMGRFISMNGSAMFDAGSNERNAYRALR